MNFKKIGIVSLIIGCIAFSCLNKNDIHEFHAEDYESMTLTNLLGTIYDNPNGIDAEISNDSFTYSIRHGTIQTNNFNIKPFEIKKEDGGNKIISSTGGHARIEWKGINIYSAEDDRIIVKFKAKKTLEFKTYADTDTLYKAGADNAEIKYYLPNINYSEEKQLSPDIVVKIDEVQEVSDFERIVTINPGQTFYWEFGFQWSGWDRNFMVGEFAGGKTNYTFAWKKTSTIENLAMSKIVSNVANNNGGLINGNLVDYNVKHGNAGELYIKDFDVVISEPVVLRTNDEYAYAENWRIRSFHNDGIIFLFYVKGYSTLSIYREKLGSDFLDGAYVKIYINDELKSSKLFGENVQLSDFDYSTTCKVGDLVIWEFSFAGEIDYRSIQMSNDSSEILTTLPTFKFTEIEHTHSWSEPGNGKEAHCDVNGWKNYSSCECGLYSEDQLGTNIIGDRSDLESWKITPGKGLIEAPGHTYGSAIYNWSEDLLTCSASRKCSTCGHEETETSNSVVTHFILPSCDTKGLDYYDVTFLNDAFVAQHKEVEIDKTEHSLLKIIGVSPKCLTSGFKDYFKCISCNKFYEDKDGTVLIENIDEWKSKDGYLAPTGHEFNEPTYIWGENDKTCIASRHCIHEGCNEIETETVETTEVDGQKVATFSNPAFQTQYKKMGSNVGLIVGLSVGGGVLLIGGIITFFIIRKKRKIVK